MKLSKLLENICKVELQQDCDISGLSTDSREVRFGDVFIALKGQQTDGHRYISQAIEQGAIAVLCEYPCEHSNVPIIVVAYLKQQVGEIAARFFNRPSEKMRIVGVTGTNGKTSTAYFIASALNRMGLSCGYIGTVGVGFPGNLSATSHTTPDAITLQRQLNEFHCAGAQFLAMEVSSHALDQHRINSVAFETAVFTNLTRDHLDYHGDMTNYGNAKRRLFFTPRLKHAVINVDDAFGQQLIKALSNQLLIYQYTTTNSNHYEAIPLISGLDIHLNHKGILMKVETPWGKGVLRSRLLGRFNANNLLAALTSLCLLGIPFEEALTHLSAVTHVPGRMEVYGGGKFPLVVVDYAHTPDALQQTLIALKEHVQGQLWCVFGCGGNRDQGKRQLMGQIAERYSDQLIITDDNPRHEDPEVITNHITEGLLCPWAAEVEHDRSAAIAHAIGCAQPGDVVLIAGKGHENYQIIGDEKLPFDDVEQVQMQLRLRQKLY